MIVLILTNVGSFLCQICYLEFLKSSQNEFGTTCPRLNLWSSTAVSYLVNVDCYGGFPTRFGRLPVCIWLCFLHFNDFILSVS